MGICELQRTKRRHLAHAGRGHIFGDLLYRSVVQLAPGRRRLWQELPVTRPFISGAKRARTADLLRAKHQARRLTGRRGSRLMRRRREVALPLGSGDAFGRLDGVVRLDPQVKAGELYPDRALQCALTSQIQNDCFFG